MLMAFDLYPIGVIMAVVAGSAINLGIVIQKKAVNEIPVESRDAKFMRTLVHRRTWLLGLVLQIAIGTTSTIIAQAIIGPALLPGLLAVGLIPMAIGAAKIVKESLKRPEILAIGLIIVAAILLTASDISIPILTDPQHTFNVMNPVFLGNEWEFTAVFFVVIIVAEIVQRKLQKGRSIALACQAGCLLALSNYWLSPITVHVVHIFTGALQLPWELVLGLMGAVVLISGAVLNIVVLQKAFKVGNASLVIPIEQVPINIAPILVYFWIFSLTARTVFTIPFLLVAIVLIILSSYLLARRQSQLENIKVDVTQTLEDGMDQEAMVEG
jgi:hypothetical protein